MPYKWSWTFVSRVDCYEPNDSLAIWPDPIAGSKSIPLNQVLAAYSLAGHQTYGISGSEPHVYDWYAFTLDEPAEVWAATLTTPLNQSIRVRRGDALDTTATLRGQLSGTATRPSRALPDIANSSPLPGQ